MQYPHPCMHKNTRGREKRRVHALACTHLQKHKTPGRSMHDLQERTDHLRATVQPLENAWKRLLASLHSLFSESSLMGCQNSWVHTTVTLCHLLVKGCGLPLRQSYLTPVQKKTFFLMPSRSEIWRCPGQLSHCGVNTITCRDEPQAQGRVCEDHGDVGAAKWSPGLPSLLFLPPREITLQRISSA